MIATSINHLIEPEGCTVAYGIYFDFVSDWSSSIVRILV